jgi:hypothetical protein
MHETSSCIFYGFAQIALVEGGEQFHVVVLGAGFGGLTFCKHFRHPDARYKNYCRISFGPEIEKLELGLNAFERVIAKFK